MSLFIKLAALSSAITLVAMTLTAFEIPEEIIMNKFSEIPAIRKKENPFLDTYSPVRMPHQTHMMIIDCGKCHHKWDDQMHSPGKCTSTGCHDILDRNPKSSRKTNAASFAYHSRGNDRSCIGCHQSNKMAGEVSGPVACSGCHPGR